MIIDRYCETDQTLSIDRIRTIKRRRQFTKHKATRSGRIVAPSSEALPIDCHFGVLLLATLVQ